MDARRPSNDTERRLRSARLRVEQLIESGEEHAAKLVLHEHPDLAADAESAIEIIYAEFLALDASGRMPESNSWLDRYPTHRPRLERLLKLHDFLSADNDQALAEPKETTTLGERVAEQDVADQPFARYELLNEVGRGGMGIVYRARQRGLGRIVAVKVLRSIDSHPKVLLRFQQEAETVASLQHPNIVQVIEISLDPGKEFLSMEYLGGGLLEARIQEKSWSNHEIAELMQTLAQAVHYAHERGIIHRDLKPANILFTAELTPKIVDFGLAKKIDDELRATVTGGVVGTPCYMSPEQAAGNDAPIGAATDIYSLGVIMYQMLTKRLPFEGKTALETLRWIVERECEPPSRFVAGVPRDLETICLKCLAKAPADRYLSAQELADDLARFLDHLPIRARRAGWLERWSRKMRRHPQVVALASSIVVVAIGASTVLYFQNRTVDQLSRANAQYEQSEAKLRQRVTQAEGAYEASLAKARASVKEWTQLGLRLESEPGMDGLRRKAFEDAVAYYQECLAADAGDDAIRFEAAVAAIRAAYFHADLGQYETAQSELQLAEKWLGTLPVDHRVKWNRGDIQILLANILRRVDRWDESQQAYESAIKIVGELLDVDPNNTGYLIRQSNAMVNLCVVYKYQSKWDESLQTYVQAMRLGTKAAALRAKQAIPDFLARNDAVDLPNVPAALNEVTRYLSNLCDQLQRQNPSLLASLAKENYLPEIALCLDDVGQVFETQSQVAQAEKSYREAIRIRTLSQTLAQENRRIDQFLARSETNLGKLLAANDRIEEARENLNAADRYYSKLVADFPERTDFRTEWSHCLMTLSQCSRSQQSWGQAAEFAGQAVQQLKVVHQHAKSLAVQDSLASAMLAHAYYLRRTGDQPRGIDELGKARELAKERFSPSNSHAWMLSLEEPLTEDDARLALELSETATRLSPQSGYLWNTRALVLARVARWQESLEAIEKAMLLGSGGSASDWYIKSMALAGSGDFHAARHWFAMADGVRVSQSPSHAELRRQAKLAESLLNRVE